MMVKIAILSHGLIHNTKVILPPAFIVHLCTKFNFMDAPCQEVYGKFSKIIFNAPETTQRSSHPSHLPHINLYPHQMLTVLKYIALIGTFFIYTTSGVFSKLASQREFLSPGYIAFLACTVGVLGNGT